MNYTRLYTQHMNFKIKILKLKHKRTKQNNKHS